MQFNIRRLRRRFDCAGAEKQVHHAAGRIGHGSAFFSGKQRTALKKKSVPGQYGVGNRFGEVGFCIGKNWWGQGIMTEAMKTVMAYLFEEVGMQRIEAGHDPNNPASGAVQRKCGLKYEGTFRRRIRSNQGVTDVAWYAALKEEWTK